jgi:hypothetical protein
VGIEQTPVSEVVREFARSDEVYGLGIGGAWLHTGRHGSAFGGAVTAHRRLGRGFRLGVTFLGPFLGAEWSANGGTTTAHEELLLLMGRHDAFRFGRFGVGPEALVGAFRLTARGEVDPPLRGSSDEVWSFAAAGGIGMDLRVFDSVWLTG